MWGNDDSTPTEVGRFLEWLFLLAFFVIVPAAILFAAAFAVHLLEGAFVSSTSQSPAIAEFFSELPFILMTFYSGTLGGVVAYVYARIQMGVPTDLFVTKIAKLLFSGSLGVAVFFFLRSAALIKMFYPTLINENVYSLLFVAFVAGLLGPRLVRGIRSRSRNFIQANNVQQE